MAYYTIARLYLQGVPLYRSWVCHSLSSSSDIDIDIATHAVITDVSRPSICVLYCLFPVVSVCGMDTQLLQSTYTYVHF